MFVLLVEDDDVIADAICTYLTHQGLTHENDGGPGIVGGSRTGDDRARRVVAAHRIDGDRQHQMRRGLIRRR